MLTTAADGSSLSVVSFTGNSTPSPSLTEAISCGSLSNTKSPSKGADSELSPLFDKLAMLAIDEPEDARRRVPTTPINSRPAGGVVDIGDTVEFEGEDTAVERRRASSRDAERRVDLVERRELPVSPMTYGGGLMVDKRRVSVPKAPKCCTRMI